MPSPDFHELGVVGALNALGQQVALLVEAAKEATAELRELRELMAAMQDDGVEEEVEDPGFLDGPNKRESENEDVSAEVDRERWAICSQCRSRDFDAILGMSTGSPAMCNKQPRAAGELPTSLRVLNKRRDWVCPLGKHEEANRASMGGPNNEGGQ